MNFDLVERAIRGRNFGVLSTVSRDGKPHSVGVLYGVSSPSKPLALYLTTNRESKKARNIARNPNVSFTIPVPRRFLRFMPPNCMQFQGTAEIIPFEDEAARDAFNESLIMRQTLKLEGRHVQRRAVFIRIQPSAIIFTYGLGVSILGLVRNISGASARTEIPRSRLENQAIPRLGDENSAPAR